MTIKELYNTGRRLLSPAAISGCNADFEARCLVQHFTGCATAVILAEGSRPVTEDCREQFMEAVRRRLEGYPLQYILGEWDFYGLTFKVGEGVLIPRPETELLVDTVLAQGERGASLNVLDICSGSGCIAIAIASQRPEWKLWALELSEKAFSYLQHNTRMNGAKALTAVQGDALCPPDGITAQKYDFIVSNPPYIGKSEMDTLQTEIMHEPHMALFAEDDGMYFYKNLPLIYKPYLNSGGRIIFEIGYAQGKTVADVLTAAGYADVEIKKDYEGNDRVVMGRLP